MDFPSGLVTYHTTPRFWRRSASLFEFGGHGFDPPFVPVAESGTGYDSIVIARLRGEVVEVSEGRLVVSACGVGYEVWVPESVIAVAGSEGLQVDLFVRQVFREDDQALYGFLDRADRRLFDMVREVKGCGPRIGLSLVGRLGSEALAAAIAAQDTKMLCSVSGVGPKLAERLIVELREKVSHERVIRKIDATQGRAAVAMDGTGDELVDALVALGYRRLEAEAAASEARRVEGELEDHLRLALQRLRR